MVRIAGRFRPHPSRLAPLVTQQPVEKQDRRRRHPLLLNKSCIRAFKSRSDDALNSNVASIDAPVTMTSSP